MKKIIIFSILCLFSIIHAEEKLHIKADVFEIDGKTNQVVASGNVVVTLRDVNIYGKYCTYNQKAQLVHMTKTVRVVKDEMVLTCNEVIADGQKEIISAEGGIRFNYKTIKGQSEYALYELGKRHVSLTGTPRAWQGEDELLGEVIEIDLEKVKIITKGKAKVRLTIDKLKEGTKSFND